MNRTVLLASVLSSGWHPRKMFAAGDLGTIQNPSNLPSIYQESTSVTAGAVGSLVGTVLDERYFLARGANLVSNGAAFADTTGWACNANATLSANAGALRATTTATTGASTVAGQAITTVVGKSYELSVRYAAAPAFNCFMSAGTSLGATTNLNINMGQTPGTYRAIFTATATTTYVGAYSASTITAGAFFEIDDIVCTLVDGSRAIQSAAGSRPTLDAGGKINYSAGTKSLVTTFPADMGAACTVGRSVPQGEATILTGQTITTTYTDNTDHCGLVIINRALSITETNRLRRWLNRRAR